MPISKQRKTGLLIIVLLSIIALTSFISFKSLHIKFHNKTGENLDSLVVAGTLIGHLKNNSSTEYIDFKEFTFNDNIPYEQIDGIIKSKKISQFNWSDCGTGIETKSKGSYIFDIKKGIDDEGNACLYLVDHNKKIFWEEN